MFAFLTPRDRAPPRRVFPPAGEPTPLLRHLAGDFAPRVAGLWPAPHTAFVTAPAERRHLVLIALARAGDAALVIPHDFLLEESLKDAVALVAPDAPAGLRRALAHLGETGWSSEDYVRLFHVLRAGAKQVRHAEAITPELVRALASLPEPLLRARVGGFGLNEGGTRLLGEAFRLITAEKGHEAAAAAVLRWSRTNSPRTLFEAVEDDLLPPFPPPPFPATGRLVPLRTRAEVREAAQRYQNCLRGRIGEIARGRSAVYEWVGTPGTIVEVVRDDVYGWRLNEAAIRRNEAVPAAARERIQAELEALGVHVGLSSYQLQSALESAQEGNAWFPENGAGETWMWGD